MDPAQFLEDNARRARGESMTEAAIEHARYFAEQAEQGRVLTFAKFQEWMREQHGVEGSRAFFERQLRDEGIPVWWRTK